MATNSIGQSYYVGSDVWQGCQSAALTLFTATGALKCSWWCREGSRLSPLFIEWWSLVLRNGSGLLEP